MKYVYPDFYFDFECIADKCRHSCCISWEIDIDDDSLEYYEQLDTALGEDIRNNISKENYPHFVLGEDERCPFLRSDGLCRIICEMSEEALCSICSEHPRFYNCFDDREEAGLGLCCEEAARLLLEGEKPLGFIAETDDSKDDTGISGVKYELLKILAEQDSPLSERIKHCLELAGAKPVSGNASEWAEFLLGLERLDEEWTKKLTSIKSIEKPLASYEIEGIRYERLLSYFVYRHINEENMAEMFGFCLFSVYIIYALDCVKGYDAEHTRLYSSEIEYSDENVELILAKIAAMT